MQKKNFRVKVLFSVCGLGAVVASDCFSGAVYFRFVVRFYVGCGDIWSSLEHVAVKDCVQEEGDSRLSPSSTNVSSHGQVETVELEHANPVCL